MQPEEKLEESQEIVRDSAIAVGTYMSLVRGNG